MRITAFIIHHIDKGALKAMKTLGLVTSKKPDVQEVEDAFACVYNHLSTQIPQEHHAHIALDEIMIEHLLCKYQRTLRIKR